MMMKEEEQMKIEWLEMRYNCKRLQILILGNFF